MRAVLLTLSLILVQVSGFAIRAPRLPRELSGVDDNSLSDALRVLEREKRRLDNEASFRDWEPGYYDNWSDEDDAQRATDDDAEELSDDFDVGGSDDGDVSGDIAEYLAGLLRQEEPGAPFAAEPGLDDLDGDSEGEAEREDTEKQPGVFNSEQVTIDELKDIFNDDRPPERKTQGSVKSKKVALRKKKTPEVENSLLGDRERMSETLKADKEKNKAARKRSSISRSSIDLKHLSRSQIQELLNEVDKMEKQEVLEQENSGKSLELDNLGRNGEKQPDAEPVSEEELGDVLGDDDESEEGEGDSAAENFDDDVDQDDGDEDVDELADTDEKPILSGAGDFSKESVSRELYGRREDRRKRLAKRDYRNASPVSKRMNHPAEISRLLEIIGKLRLKNLLENKEIDSLADALEVATNAQAQQSLDQLPKELKSLQRAIKIEESMQGKSSELSPEDEQYLRDVIEELVSRSDAEEPDDVAGDDEEDEMAGDEKDKRAGAGRYANDVDVDVSDETSPTFADHMGQWYEEPIVSREPAYDDANDEDEITEEDVAKALEEEEENEEANEILEDLIDRYRAEETLAAVPDAEEDEDGDEEAEVSDLYPPTDAVDDEEERSPPPLYQDALARLFRDEQVDEATQREIEQALAQFQHNVEPWQRRELENRIRDYEQCSALDSIVSDCRLADELNIPIDDEARELCSRHEACYTCGGVLGKASGQCDAGYLAEAFQLCGGAEKCNLKADAFLRLLQYYHRYSASSNAACEHQCVVDYIYGVAL